MTQTYDWSKLDAGWQERGGELRWYTETSTVYPFLVSVMESQADDYAPDRSVVDGRWCDLYPEAKAQLAKCRIECEPPAYDNYTDIWNKPYPDGLRCKSCGADRSHTCPGPGGVRPDASTVEGQASVERELNAIQSQFTELAPPECDHDWDDTCRVCVKCGKEFGFERAPINNTPLFEAMDRIAAEAGAKDVPQYVCSACGKHGLHLCEKFYPEPPSTKWFYPSQPWRRGPLATWTLVNISNHDGRLTVVMKRGRSECLIETGVDDEGIWERLGLKAVEVDKAKAKAESDRLKDMTPQGAT